MRNVSNLTQPTPPDVSGGRALRAIAAYLERLESSGQVSRALHRQRSWALREAVLFAAVRRLNGPEPLAAAPLTPADRDRAVAESARVTLEELFTDAFVDAWLDQADPVLRGVTEHRTATQRARVTSLRALAAFTGDGLPEHRHPQPVPRTLLTTPEVESALSALSGHLPGRGPDDHVRLAAVLAVMSVWPVRSVELSQLEVRQVGDAGADVLLRVDPPDEGPRVLRGVAAERLRAWLEVRTGLLAELQGGPVRAVWTSIRSNSRPGGPRGSLPLPPGMPLRPRGLQRAYARSVEAANAMHHGLPGFPLPRSLDLLRRSLEAR
jgi:integrase